MYVQEYMKKELFINFFSLQPLQAILFLQYLLFQRKVEMMGEKRSSYDQHRHIHQKQTSSRDENIVLSWLQRKEYLVYWQAAHGFSACGCYLIVDA